MKKISKKFWSMFCVIAVLVSSFVVPAAAATPNDDGVLTIDAECLLESGNFEEISREEYISTKAEHEGITYAEAEAIVDANIEEAKGRLPAACTWEGDTIITNGDSTFTIYGRVYTEYEHSSGMKAHYEVQAVVIASHYGKTFSECDSTGTAYAVGACTKYTFDGDCTARLITTTELRMTLSGTFTVEANTATSMGFNAGLMDASYTYGGMLYYYSSVYDVHVEDLM